MEVNVLLISFVDYLLISNKRLVEKIEIEILSLQRYTIIFFNKILREKRTTYNSFYIIRNKIQEFSFLKRKI